MRAYLKTRRKLISKPKTEMNRLQLQTRKSDWNWSEAKGKCKIRKKYYCIYNVTKHCQVQKRADQQRVSVTAVIFLLSPKFLWAPCHVMWTAVLTGWDPAIPIPPLAFGLGYEGAIGTAKIDDISNSMYATPCSLVCNILVLCVSLYVQRPMMIGQKYSAAESLGIIIPTCLPTHKTIFLPRPPPPPPR